jgi:PAS domain S-box-containing protein
VGLATASVRSSPLRLLLIEDEIQDALLIVRAVEQSGYRVAWECVQTAAELEAALQRPWDAITCDWVIPGFSARAALRVLADAGVDVPLIIVSGQAAEEVAVTAMRAGAHDVISKHNLTRLGPALERELRDTEVRREHRRMQAALRASEARYRRLFETARDGIFILDAATGRIIDVNPFLTALLGHSREELLGRQLWELGPFRDIAANQNMFRDLQTRHYVRYEHLPLVSGDGRHADVEFISNDYDVDGERVIQCNVRDISERKQAERAIQALNADLERRVDERTVQVEALNAELQAFSHSVSHDLRAPLRQVEQFSQLLLEEHAAQLDGAGRECLDHILKSTRRMGQLITDLLRLSKTTAAEMRPQAVDLSALCQAIVSDLRRGEPDRRVEIVIEPAVVAEGDPGLLRVALENLLNNCWKYTSTHPAARIEFGRTGRDGGVIYFVRDDGVGFDMAHVGKLFGAFQRLHGEAEFEGTGIGLATVQRIVHRHGGRVWAESAVDRGTTIYFTLAPSPRPA